MQSASVLQQKDLARQAAKTLWEKGISAEIQADPRTPEFARAALAELQLLRESTPGILKDVLDGAEVGAAQLDVDPMHGLAELVQNADDVGATEIKMAVRSRGAKRDLIVIHNGKPVCLPHVLAMTMAFISTKRNDPLSTGKFGIGLRTLSRIADSMEVDCSPYYFRIVGNRIEARSKPKRIRNFYNPKSELTLIVLPRKESESASDIRQWIKSWSATKMLFLRGVRSLLWVDISTGRVLTKHYLSEVKVNSPPSWRRRGKDTITVESILSDRKNSVTWTRYDGIVPIPKGLNRQSKTIGTDAIISVALSSPTTPALLYASLPTNIELRVPFAINAPFDVNTARNKVPKSNWNDWLWRRISEFVSELVIHLLENEPKAAWYLVPVSDELEVEGDSGVSGWLQGVYKYVKD